jgi:hypothetical protein
MHVPCSSAMTTQLRTYLSHLNHQNKSSHLAYITTMPRTNSHHDRSHNLTDAQKGAIIALRCSAKWEFPYIAGELGIAVSTPGNVFRATTKACREAELEPTLANMLATSDKMSKREKRLGRPRKDACTPASKKGNTKAGQPPKTTKNETNSFNTLLSLPQYSHNFGYSYTMSLPRPSQTLGSSALLTRSEDEL